MRKLLLVLFLLIISSVGVFGYIAATETDQIEVEVPNNEIIRTLQ